jgi:hypothetical protein
MSRTNPLVFLLPCLVLFAACTARPIGLNGLDEVIRGTPKAVNSAAIRALDARSVDLFEKVIEGDEWVLRGYTDDGYELTVVSAPGPSLDETRLTIQISRLGQSGRQQDLFDAIRLDLARQSAPAP